MLWFSCLFSVCMEHYLWSQMLDFLLVFLISSSFNVFFSPYFFVGSLVFRSILISVVFSLSSGFLLVTMLFQFFFITIFFDMNFYFVIRLVGHSYINSRWRNSVEGEKTKLIAANVTHSAQTAYAHQKMFFFSQQIVFSEWEYQFISFDEHKISRRAKKF